MSVATSCSTEAAEPGKAAALPDLQRPGLPSIRLHVAGRLTDGERLDLAPAQAHYLGSVMRRTPGDAIRLFNGIDGEHLATVAELKRDRCAVTIGAQLRPQAAEADLWLVFALLKRQPMDLVVQKATELGVSRLIPVFTTRTNADRTNIDRLRLIAIEAAEQSERLSIPALQEPRALNAVLAQWPPDRRLTVCVERNAHPPIRPQSGCPAALLVGPEGGFTGPELDAVSACPFVDVATLGPRILRAETAAIVGLALLQAC